MISQMDQVYSNASLTIIDASGKDTQSGLPGVSSFSRRPQKCAYIRNTAILDLPCGQIELESSKWATRGWTYQEGYFSRRRLIFTASQVLFLCNTSCAEESVCRLSQQLSPHGHKQTFMHLTNSVTAFKEGEKFTRQLEEYSKRDLTYHKDSLNAFLGVLNSYTHMTRTRKFPVLHLFWGLVAQSHDGAGDICVCLDWYHKAPAERRPGFPSWAWTGWGGPLSIQGPGIMLHNRENDSWPLKHLEWEISWESKDHKTVTIWEFANDCRSRTYTDELHPQQQAIYPNRLKVTCFVVPIRFQAVSLTEDQRNQETLIDFEKEMKYMMVKRRGLPSESVPVVQVWKGIYIAAAGYLDQVVNIQDCVPVVGLMFVKGGFNKVTAGCLLARQLDEGLYERVGAIPLLLDYHQAPLNGGFADSQSVFLDETGSVLERVTVSAAQKLLSFDGVGERRTIFLV